MKILIDTNVALDVLLNRTEFFQASYDVLKLTALGRISGFVTTSAVTDIFYVLRKNSKDAAKSKDAILQLLKLVSLADVVATDITVALVSNMSDFEDAVVSTVAKRLKADCIVTRNTKDFSNSSIPAIEPQEFLNKYFPTA